MAELELPYVPIDPGIDTSEPMLAFLDALGDDHGQPDPENSIIRLLMWAGKDRPTGDLKRISPRRLAHECRWRGDPVAWFEAVVAGGWLEDNGECGWRVVGWAKYGGRVLADREDFREQGRLRKKRQRCREGGHKDETCDCLGKDAAAARTRHAESRGGHVTSRDVTESHAVEPEGEPEPEGEGEHTQHTQARATSEPTAPPPEPERRTSPAPRGVAPVELSRAPPSLASDVSQVFAHWRTRPPGDQQFMQIHSGLEEYREIERRLRADGFTVEQLQAAIDGLHLDPWDDRARNLQLIYAVRTPQAVYRLMEIARNPAARAPPAAGADSAAQRAAAAWAQVSVAIANVRTFDATVTDQVAKRVVKAIGGAGVLGRCSAPDLVGHKLEFLKRYREEVSRPAPEVSA